MKPDWKFGDVIERHEDGGTEKRRAMVLYEDDDEGHMVIGLSQGGPERAYALGKIGKTLWEYWTLIDGD